MRMMLPFSLILLTAAPVAAQDAIIIRAGTLFDGHAGAQRNVSVVVEGSRIVRVDGNPASTPTYDFSRLTVLPGLIDTHVHIVSHFGKDGRASNEGETPSERMLYTAENAYVTL